MTDQSLFILNPISGGKSKDSDRKKIEAFINVIPQLMITAPEWTKIIHYRIINDELACKIYQDSLESANKSTPHFLYQLLNESVKSHINSQQELAVI